MLNHNFILGPVDTDSISFCKPDFSNFSKEEQNNLLNEINAYFPELIKYDHDGYFKTCITLKAKNYILQDFDGKIIYKGSALKSSKIEPALKEFLHKIIDTILEEKFAYKEIYESYIKEILNLQDINRWASKKSLTSTTYQSQRANETKIIDAIKGTEYKEGDRIFTYFDVNDNLKLAENYKNDHNIEKLIAKLYATSKIFTHIDNKPIGLLPKDTFINFALKKNEQLLKELK